MICVQAIKHYIKIGVFLLNLNLIDIFIVTKPTDKRQGIPKLCCNHDPSAATRINGLVLLC